VAPYPCLDVNHDPTRWSVQVPSVADYPAGARMHPRVIEDFEFVWMLRGDAWFVTGERVTGLSPGRLLLVPPDVPHRFEWDQRQASRHGYVHFRPHGNVAAGLADPRTHRMTEHDPQAGLCAYLLWLGREQPAGWQGAVQRTLAALTTLVVSGPLPTDGSHEPLPVPIETAVGYLRRAWTAMPLGRIGVAELATAASVSRSYFSRRFRAEFGMGASEALEGLRCIRAETLLLHTDMTIGSVARNCGFADVYHFSHRFKLRYGIAPSEYRPSRGGGSSALDHPGLRRLASAVWP